MLVCLLVCVARELGDWCLKVSLYITKTDCIPPPFSLCTSHFFLPLLRRNNPADNSNNYYNNNSLNVNDNNNNNSNSLTVTQCNQERSQLSSAVAIGSAMVRQQKYVRTRSSTAHSGVRCSQCRGGYSALAHSLITPHLWPLDRQHRGVYSNTVTSQIEHTDSNPWSLAARKLVLCEPPPPLEPLCAGANYLVSHPTLTGLINDSE